MIGALATQKLLGELRGEAPVDRDQLASVLLALSKAAEADPRIVGADLNPLIVTADGSPVAVDALIELADEDAAPPTAGGVARSEEHTSELQSLMRISYAVFCLKKKNKNKSAELYYI